MASVSTPAPKTPERQGWIQASEGRESTTHLSGLQKALAHKRKELTDAQHVQAFGVVNLKKLGKSASALQNVSQASADGEFRDVHLVRTNTETMEAWEHRRRNNVKKTLRTLREEDESTGTTIKVACESTKGPRGGESLLHATVVRASRDMATDACEPANYPAPVSVLPSSVPALKRCCSLRNKAADLSLRSPLLPPPPTPNPFPQTELVLRASWPVSRFVIPRSR